MLNICELDAAGVFTGQSQKIKEEDGCPPGWVRADIPDPYDGVVARWAFDGWEFIAPPDPLPTLRAAKSEAVMAMRESRIEGGFTFEDVRYQSRGEDRENIAGAAQLGFMALIAGAQPGDLRWANPDQDFLWIAEDNDLVAMDAPTVVSFGKAAAGFKQACIFAAFALKAAIENAPDLATLDAIDLTQGWPG